jgi:flagellar operon protein
MVDRIGRINKTNLTGHVAQPLSNVKKNDFASVLNSQMEQIRFSSHAQNRLRSRSIIMDQKKLQSLNEAVNLAASKGAKESLVLLDDLAMVVSVTNRTVITAFHRNETNVFTNIDSAVIV